MVWGIARTSALALLLGACSSDAEAPGQLMLLVSTDLAIPADIDALRLTVTPADEAIVLVSKTYELEVEEGHAILPGSFALFAKDAVGPLLVRLEALQGGEKGEVRVRREAELEIPTHGVKSVPLSLNWLCREERPQPACASDHTCVAGACVSRALPRPSELPDFAPKPQQECIDVKKRFEGAAFGQPEMREERGCVIAGSLAANAEDVDVALVVKTETVGNFGVCDPKNEDGRSEASSECLVPLDYGGEGGWTTERNSRGDAVAIRIPDAVCAEVGRGIAGVRVIQNDLERKISSTPVCIGPPTCISASSGCPEGWRAHTCSGSARPTPNTGEICGRFKTDPLRGPSTPMVPGFWCCGRNPEPSSDNPLLIDDMSGGPRVKLRPPNQKEPGSWYVASGDLLAPLSPPRTTPEVLFEYRTIAPPVSLSEDLTIERAACLAAPEGFTGSNALVGFTFLTSHGQPVEFDLRPYAGIRFWARAEPQPFELPSVLTVEVPNVDTYTEVVASTCVLVDKATCHPHFVDLILRPEWRHYTVLWSELHQSDIDWGQQFFPRFQERAFAVNFMIRGAEMELGSFPFDFCVAHIEFVEKKAELSHE